MAMRGWERKDERTRRILSSLAFYCLIATHLCATPQTLADYEAKYRLIGFGLRVVFGSR